MATTGPCTLPPTNYPPLYCMGKGIDQKHPNVPNKQDLILLVNWQCQKI